MKGYNDNIGAFWKQDNMIKNTNRLLKLSKFTQRYTKLLPNQHNTWPPCLQIIRIKIMVRRKLENFIAYSFTHTHIHICKSEMTN